MLFDYNPTVTCGPESYRYTRFTCCARTAAQPVPATPNSGPVSGPAHFALYKCCLGTAECSVEVQGDDATCKSEADLEAAASRSCADQGRTLSSLGFYGAC